MIVTCDSSCNMGYIYLIPHTKDNEDLKNIDKYVNMDLIQIPFFNNADIREKFQKLQLMDKTYVDALAGDEFSEEYCNDKRDDYFIGIELTLYKEKFINLIKEQAYRIYKFLWFDYKPFHLICLDKLENIFTTANILYPMNVNRDVYVVCHINEEICYIKGIISARDDLYPLNYLLKPEFYLYE